VEQEQEQKGKEKDMSMLVSQHWKTLNLKNCQISEMLLNRESNPGLPRLVVSNHMTTGVLLVVELGIYEVR
jgi:hypothetical protein